MVWKTNLRYSPKFSPQAGHCDFPDLMLTYSYLACTGIIEPASATCQLQQLAGARLASKDACDIVMSIRSMQQQCFTPDSSCICATCCADAPPGQIRCTALWQCIFGRDSGHEVEAGPT